MGRVASATRAVGLVARRSDRVVAAADGAHPAGGEVELAAHDLGGEQRPQALDLAPRRRSSCGAELAPRRRRSAERVQRASSASSSAAGVVGSEVATRR